MEEKKPRFIKKPEAGKNAVEDAERQAEMVKNRPVRDSKLKIVFVNGSKYRRALDILNLIRGIRPPQKVSEEQRREHYIRQLAAHDIKTDSEEALPAIYEILGGLIRTDQEQQEAEQRAAEMRAKGKKRMIS